MAEHPGRLPRPHHVRLSTNYGHADPAGSLETGILTRPNPGHIKPWQERGALRLSCADDLGLTDRLLAFV